MVNCHQYGGGNGAAFTTLANMSTPQKASSDPADRAEDRHDQAFGQHLPNESPARRAERAANGQLLGAQRGAAELHVHHVHTGDQQNDE